MKLTDETSLTEERGQNEVSHWNGQF